MRLIVFGLTVSSSWGNGHATIWRGLCSALGRMGHAVTFFEKDVPYYRRHRDLTNPEGYKLQLYESWDEIRTSAAKAVAESECAIVTSYCPDGRAASDLVLDSGVLSAFYDLDTPVTLCRLATEGTVDYIPTYGLEPFDLVLSYTGGTALAQLKDQLGARRVAPLYGSVDPEIHRRVPSDPRFTADLSYLGTYAADRQSQLERLFLNPAKELEDKRFCIGGAQYPTDFPWTSNIYFFRHLPPAEHPAFYSSSRLTLNITRQAMAQMGYCPSGRLFEAAACRTPIVSDYWEGLEEFFEPGQEILTVDTADDVVKALNSSDDELRKVSTASQERTLSQHTAAHRAAELVGLIEGNA